jgi:nucleotide-binding universal stress UspA family protein
VTAHFHLPIFAGSFNRCADWLRRLPGIKIATYLHSAKRAGDIDPDLPMVSAMKVKKILFPTDFSECSQAALACASVLASESKAQLFIVHVDDIPAAYIEGLASGYAGHGYVPKPENTRDDIREQLSRVSPTISHVHFEHRYLRGNPADQILKFAERENVDLIVMGTHGRTAALQLLMGSVAEAVVRRANCPVLTLKRPFVQPEIVEQQKAASRRAIGSLTL